MSYSCAIIDDEPPSHEVLKSYLDRTPDLILKGQFFNARDADHYLRQESVDVLFLDIQMPEITGIEFLRALENRPVTIFTTAFRDYAFEGYELGVIDYLLKPVTFERFETAVGRALDFLRQHQPDTEVDAEAMKSSKSHDVLIKSGTKKILVDYRQILYAQGLKDYTILYTANTRYVVKGSIKSFGDYLPAQAFIRVHKSFIVACNQLRLVYRNKIEIGKISIPIGRSYRAAVDTFLATKGS